MGDPECQAILPRLKTDIRIFYNSVKNNLNKIKINWSKKRVYYCFMCQRISALLQKKI